MQRAGHLAVERDAAGDAQVAASGLAQRQAREVECGLLEPLLHGEGDVTVALRDLLVWGRAAVQGGRQSCRRRTGRSCDGRRRCSRGRSARRLA